MKMEIRHLHILICSAFLSLILDFPSCFGQIPPKLKIKFVDYFFENGSPVSWSIQGDSVLKILLLEDHERGSVNCQTTNWHFRVVADSGTHLKLLISKIQPDVYNGKQVGEWWDAHHPISCYFSYDHKAWTAVKTILLDGRELFADIRMKGSEVWVARLPAYSIQNLENLKSKFRGNKLFTAINIGSTLEGRPLEIIRLGSADAKYSFIIRARAHPWEPGGNWVVEGLINKFITENSPEWQRTFCVYIMPMANKDGVARGMTRFNAAGMDLNRKWDKMSDPLLCPEKYALEKFIEELIKSGTMPTLGIDIHNDDAGGINLATHRKDDTLFIKKIKYFEKLMRENTLFSEEVRYSWEIPGQQDPFVLFEDGLYGRYGIEALVWELNANWIGSLNKMPSQYDWIRTGEMLNDVFYSYLTGKMN